MTNHLSLRARLTVWYTLVLVIVLAAFGADILWAQRRVGIRHLDRELETLATAVVRVVADELQEQEPLTAAVDEARRVVVPPGDVVAVLDTDGTIVAGHWGTLPSAALRRPVGNGATAWTVDTPGGAWRVREEAQMFQGRSRRLVVAASLSELGRERAALLESLQVAVPLVLLLAVGGGFWLASLGLRPIRDMAVRASAIEVGGGDDLGYAERADEMGTLARSFNGLVARLRSALRTQQQFMADASHELRTPLSVIRAAADVGLAREGRSERDYRETLTTIGDQARRLGRLVDHMLMLARADAGGYPLHRVELYLNDLVAECCRALEPLSAERQVSIRTGAWPEVPFLGDEDLLRQLVLNVVQNAVQHTPPGGSVEIGLAARSDRVEIRVRDAGPGIPAADRGRVFDRFVQLDAARRGAGAGLGLPIAKWIAEAHGGTLTLESSGVDGSTFCISLAVSAAPLHA